MVLISSEVQLAKAIVNQCEQLIYSLISFEHKVGFHFDFCHKKEIKSIEDLLKKYIDICQNSVKIDNVSDFKKQ